MTNRAQREAFVKLPRELLESAAWRSLGINARRLLDFLSIEHMNHGGKANGKLLAPWRQLERFGIGSHFVSSAIEECERKGLVNCRRGVGRLPSVYGLTWLPLCDGSEPSNRWRAYHPEIIAETGVLTAKQQSLIVTAKQQSLIVTAKQQSFTDETAVTKPVATAKQQSQSPKSSTAKQQHLSRKLLTTAKPKGCGKNDNGEPAVGRDIESRDAQKANHPNPGKPNGRIETATVVPLRRGQ
jgi:hypothetical protein